MAWSIRVYRHGQNEGLDPAWAPWRPTRSMSPWLAFEVFLRLLFVGGPHEESLRRDIERYMRGTFPLILSLRFHHHGPRERNECTACPELRALIMLKLETRAR